MNAKIAALFQRQANLLLNARAEPFGIAVRDIGSEFIKRGVYDSTMRSQAVARAYRSEYDQAVLALWEALHRIAVGVGVAPDDDLASSLWETFRASAEPYGGRLVLGLRGERLFGHQAGWLEGLYTEAGESFAAARERVRVEIDLFVASIEPAAQKEEKVVQHKYDFHGPVGTVQTGASSSAIVTQTNISFAPLITALEDLRPLVVAHAPDAGPFIEGVVAELKQPAPDEGFVRKGLKRIGGLVSTVSDLGGAWGAVTAAASVLGLG